MAAWSATRCTAKAATTSFAGGANDDIVHGDYMYPLGSARIGPDPLFGDEGIDQVYGDEGTDFLFGDAGRNEGTAAAPNWVQRGQRLWGGSGIDFLYAFANVGITATPAAIAAETQLWGDELHGGSGGDWLYGNLRRDVMFGDSGNEYMAGDYLAGATLAQNEFSNLIGGGDIMFGGTGEDQLLGGGGDDELWGGGDTDWLEGQMGKRYALRRQRHRHDGARHAPRVLRTRGRGRRRHLAAGRSVGGLAGHVRRATSATNSPATSPTTTPPTSC